MLIRVAKRPLVQSHRSVPVPSYQAAVNIEQVTLANSTGFRLTFVKANEQCSQLKHLNRIHRECVCEVIFVQRLLPFVSQMETSGVKHGHHQIKCVEANARAIKRFEYSCQRLNLDLLVEFNSHN